MAKKLTEKCIVTVKQSVKYYHGPLNIAKVVGATSSREFLELIFMPDDREKTQHCEEKYFTGQVCC